nr:multidrug resistance-associated protein 5 [Tanacetum cinerariifolium]
MLPSSNSNVMVVNVNYGGGFLKKLLTYSLGVVNNIGHIDIQMMEFNDLIEFFEKITSDDVEDEVSSDENWSANEEGDDSDSNEKVVEHGVVCPCYDPTINWKKLRPMIGLKFESVKQLKESMIDYSVSNGYP